MNDAIIVGAGPAGLMAAIYLGRFHRPPLVIDGNDSRARWIPKSHNILGFPEGIGGQELLSQLRAHAERYGAQIRPGWVDHITPSDSGCAVHLAGETIHGRYVVLATGVRDHLPKLAGAAEAVLRSLLRICPICDGYEATGQQIAVIGDGSQAEREAEFLKTYSSRVTLLDVGLTRVPGRRLRLAARGIELIETTLEDLIIEDDDLRLRQPSGDDRRFDVFYSALGCSPGNGLATSLGAACDENGQLIVSAHHETSISGVYAVGDVVRGLNQVIVAAAEGAVAATHIHNRLRTP